MAGGGFGGGPFGGVPWGGAGSSSAAIGTVVLPKTTVWSAFNLQPADMDQVPNFLGVVTVGQPSQFIVGSFDIASGGGVYPTDDAQLQILIPVTDTFTIEYQLSFENLPPNFGTAPALPELVTEHVYLGASDAAGPIVGFFFSQAGVAYTGSIHFVAGNMVVDVVDGLGNPSVLPLPGSAAWFTVGPGTPDTTIRIVADTTAGLVYLYVTPSVDVPISGHVLRALLPIIDHSATIFPVIDQILVSVRGTVPDESYVSFKTYTMSYSALIPNLPPKALAGSDQASKLCSIAQLDGSGSFDPEGANLTYDWRMIDAPNTSQFVAIGHGGYTIPEIPATGYTDTFNAIELGPINALEAIVAGDVLLVGGVAYTIVSTTAAPPPFRVIVDAKQIPDDLASAGFKIIRQASITGATTAKPTFYPDVAGFYFFDLRVFDGTLWSTPTGLDRSVTLVNVIETSLPRGFTPDLRFIFSYLSDFWSLVEDRDKLAVFWGALAQVSATELFTLWQHEYSKSIRDIQRTFNRRWLHYDLLLGEPIPELTATFPVWGGAESVGFVTANFNGTTLVLTSPAFASDQTLTFITTDPMTAAAFAAKLQLELQIRIDSRFTVQLIQLPGGGPPCKVRIDAPFPFSIDVSSTAPVFSATTSDGILWGWGISSAPGRVYQVDRSLEGLSLIDAFLVLDGVAYSIESIIDVAGDTYPFSRVVTKEILPDVASTSWVICGWISSELLDFYNGLVCAGDVVDLEVVEEDDTKASLALYSDITTTTALGASETYPSRLPIDFTVVGNFLIEPTVKVRLARVVRRSYVPIDSLIVDIPTLQEKIVIENDEETLRRNLDFFIEEFRGQHAIHFASGGAGGLPDVFEGARPPDRFWAEYTYLDNSPTIEANFGLAVDLTHEQFAAVSPNGDYLSAVQGLLYTLSGGPTLSNLRIGLQILLGLPFAEEAGTIEEIRKDFLSATGRILIRDTERAEVVRSYSFPKVLDLEINPDTGLEYVVGDTVVQFAPLVTGSEVIDYVKDPTWFQGMMNQGVFYEVEKFHRFLVRVDSRAFNLSALLLARNFILKLKPTYTYPLFVIELAASEADGDEISLNDEITMSGTLSLYDSVCCGRMGASNIFDEPRAAGGGWRNKFDSDDDPSTVPVYPIPEAVRWAFDKEYMCPADELEADLCEGFLAPTPMVYDSIFQFDIGTLENYTSTLVGPFFVDDPPIGLPLLTISPVTSSGFIDCVSVTLFGWTLPGPTINWWTLKLTVDDGGGPVPYPIPGWTNWNFRSNGNSEVVFHLPVGSQIPVIGGVSIVKLWIVAMGGGHYNTTWDSILVKVSNRLPVWKFDMGLPFGPPALPPAIYCGERNLVL